MDLFNQPGRPLDLEADDEGSARMARRNCDAQIYRPVYGGRRVRSITLDRTEQDHLTAGFQWC